MGYVLMILCIIFCIGVLIHMLSTDSKNVVCDEDGEVILTKDKNGNTCAEIKKEEDAVSE